jgi:hypothetical protein
MIRKFLALLLLSLTAAFAAENESRSFELSVNAGTVDRENMPVRTLLPLPAEFTHVSVTDSAGASVPADLLTPGVLMDGADKRELVFLLAALKAGQSATYKVVAATSGPAVSGFAFTETPGDNIEMSYAGRKVLRYWCKPFDDSTPANRTETYKVFHQMYDPKGERLVNKGPGGKFTHHRGIFFGFNKVSFGETKCDIWHCKGAHQAHEKVLLQEGGVFAGRQRVLISWNGPDKKPFAEEERELTAYNTPGGTLLDFQSRVKSRVGEVTVGGDPQHAGVHFRASLDVEQKTEAQTYFIRADGVGKTGETRNWSAKTPEKTVNLPWNAMSFVIGDQRYTVEYMDSPSNPKEGRYSERTYGRFGSYFETKFDEKKPLDVTYRFWLQEGAPTVEALAQHDADFDNPVSVTVK